MERYARQTALAEIGPEGQRRIMAGSVLIVGLGGLGCPVGLYLTGAGTGRIGLCDDDTVSESNLQRQTLYSEADLGQPKAEAAFTRLSSMNSGVAFDRLPCRVTEEIIARYDLVVDCTDNYAARYLIDDACRKQRKPWVHASIGSFTGRVAVFMPDAATRYSDLFPDRAEMESLPKASGAVLGSTAGTVGAIAAGEAIRLLATGTCPLAGRILAIDLNEMKFNTLEL